jgi:cbb3-type cytochrome c oxidase subunit III
MRLRLTTVIILGAASGGLLLAGGAATAVAQDQSAGRTINFEAPPPAAKKLVAKTVTTPIYRVVDGNQVDPNTYKGWQTWRAMDCERCHGPEQQGLVGPSLVERLKVIDKNRFHYVITHGIVDMGMPNFGGVPLIQQNWQDLYAFLKGRSDGNILPGDLHPIKDGKK